MLFRSTWLASFFFVSCLPILLLSFLPSILSTSIRSFLCSFPVSFLLLSFPLSLHGSLLSFCPSLASVLPFFLPFITPSFLPNLCSSYLPFFPSSFRPVFPTFFLSSFLPWLPSLLPSSATILPSLATILPSLASFPSSFVRSALFPSFVCFVSFFSWLSSFFLSLFLSFVRSSPHRLLYFLPFPLASFLPIFFPIFNHSSASIHPFFLIFFSSFLLSIISIFLPWLTSSFFLLCYPSIHPSFLLSFNPSFLFYLPSFLGFIPRLPSLASFPPSFLFSLGFLPWLSSSLHSFYLFLSYFIHFFLLSFAISPPSFLPSFYSFLPLAFLPAFIPSFLPSSALLASFHLFFLLSSLGFLPSFFFLLNTSSSVFGTDFSSITLIMAVTFSFYYPSPPHAVLTLSFLLSVYCSISDTVSNCKMLKMLLNRKGIDCDIAINGQEAVTAYKVQ